MAGRSLILTPGRRRRRSAISRLGKYRVYQQLTAGNLDQER